MRQHSIIVRSVFEQRTYAGQHPVGAHTAFSKVYQMKTAAETAAKTSTNRTPCLQRRQRVPIHSPAVESTADDCCQVSCDATQGFALVPCGHSRFCQSCAHRVADLAARCPVCHWHNHGYTHFFVNACINHDLHMCVCVCV